MKCQTRGFILDGYPVTLKQIELLNEQHIVPHKVLSIRLTAWQKEVDDVIHWYKTEHDNFHRVEGTMSKWWVGETSKQIAFESVRATQTYMDRTYQGRAASIK